MDGGVVALFVFSPAGTLFPIPGLGLLQVDDWIWHFLSGHDQFPCIIWFTGNLGHNSSKRGITSFIEN
jgi:hypothetical protein